MHLSLHHRFRKAPGRAVVLIAFALGAWLANPAFAQEAPEEPGAPVAIEPAEPEPRPQQEPVAPPAPEEPETPPASPAAPPVNRRQIVTIGGNGHLHANETSRQMVTIMGNAIVDGHVRGQCVTVLGNVTINGRVDGELVCVGGRVTLGPNAEIRGEVVAVGGMIDAAPGAVIHGERVELPFLGGFAFPSFEWLGEWFSEGLLLGRPLPHERVWAWALAGVLLVINLLFYVVFRRPIEASASALERKPAMAFVHGLLLFILFGPLVLLLLVSVVGILIVPFLIAGVFLAGFAGLIAVYRFCGGQLGLGAHPVPALILGNVLFTVLYAVPIVGFAVLAVAGLLGLGCTLTALIEGMRREARGAKPKHFPAGGPPPGTPRRVVPPAMAAPAAGLSASIAGDPAVAAAGFVEGAAAARETPSSGAAPIPPPLGQRQAPAQPQPLPLEYFERVGFWPRFGATAIDFLIVAPLSIWISSLFWWFPGDTPAFPVLWLAYHAGFWSWKSTTIGGHVLNLRVVRLDHAKMDAGIGIVRALGAILSLLPLGIGFMWASWEEERQSWHDKIAGTTIVRVPSGQALL